MNSNHWISRIKYIRIQVLGLSQEELANRLECSQVNVSAMEKGTTGKFFIPLLSFFAKKNINLNWIFKEDNSFEPMQKGDEYIL